MSFLILSSELSKLLIRYCNLSANDASLLVSHLPHLMQYGACLLVCAVVAHTAYPSWRVEVYVYGLAWESLLYGIACILCLNLVVACIASGKNLHTIAVDLVRASHNLLACINYLRLFGLVF